MNSKATEEHGWRYTPYAYVLLKARSPEIDKPPLLRLDLDFLDTSGFVILPTESPVVPIDAGAKSPPARPFTKLQLTQILDERQSKDGKLILEVKGVALGLVPDFDEILDLKSPGFHVVKTEDQPVSVSRFDPDSADNVIVSERGWLVTLQADEGLPKIPDQFAFAKAKLDEVEMTYQRYADADLAAAQPVVSLEQRYGEPSRAWIIWAGAGLFLGLIAVFAAWKLATKPRAEVAGRFAMPEQVTPFTVLGLLREIRVHPALPPSKTAELDLSIQKLEEHYFSGQSNDPTDLHAIVSTWIMTTA